MLIVCPDTMELAFLAGALSGHFSVLAAHDADEAARLVKRFGPCRLAYLTLDEDCESAVRLVRDVSGSATPVYALVHPSCPDTVGRAANCGSLDGVCQLPMAPPALQAKTRELLGLDLAAASLRPGRAILTREEVDFLIGRPFIDRPVSSRPTS
ncbi:hypothetical protein [Desulfovibrio sp. TomC]|uniref:hypothetical protein n=1 Tax=Desulfovibrio sp. TomC TaxID=1562888 RepID=UPI0005747127|nr:hypothetical protein [Desulfovibrio sp. TomC]KHK04207.1 hypothetical protein NY78_0651 [Desulfovibrio sp. TomC]